MEFDLDDTAILLMGDRDDEFPHERAIRLFQLQAWIWYPNSTKAVDHAALLAATTILQYLEFTKFPGSMRRDQGTKNLTMAHLHALSKSEEYRGLFDAVIAPDRGWSSVVLRTIDPGTFDKRIDERSPYGPMIADLIDYRLRAVLNGRTIDEANISHAVFFNWWPSKARPSPRTRFTWWKLLKRTSVFIHLVEKHGFPMRPPKLNDGDFIDSLLNPGISQARLRSFFSQYAFIIEQLQDESFVSIAATPTPIKVKPFSNEERGTIEDYKDHYLEMN